MESGAEVVALCDTNGGMLPSQVSDVVADVLDATSARLGIHCHNDTGCAVANSMAAVDAGATHVQGTINGYGERTGNADLLTVVSNLQIKQGLPLLEPAGCARPPTSPTRSPRSPTSRPTAASPTSGRARSRTRPACTPVPSRSTPTSTSTSTPRSSATTCGCWSPTWPAGPASSSRASELGFDLSGEDELLARILRKVKDLELRGYTFDAADASFELLLRREVEGDGVHDYFDVESWRVITDARGERERALRGHGQGGRRR